MIIYGSIIYKVGFISDDFTLLMRSQEQSLFNPLESHHYSLLINMLFFGVNKGWITASFFHILALIFHFLNTCLIFLLLTNKLKMNKEYSILAVCFFALNPAGVEAIVWCCALPYVIITTIILTSIYLYYTFFENKISSLTTSLLLASLQGLGFLIWDWAILLFPIICIIVYFNRQQTNKYLPLISCGIIWFSILIIKKLFGLSLGYHINSFYQIVGTLLMSPFLTFFPFAQKNFYLSITGVICSLMTFIFFIWMCLKHKLAKMFFSIFLMTLLPQAILGHPQSRYYYFSSIALYAIIPIYLMQYPLRKSLNYSFFLFFFALSIYFTSKKIRSWEEASLVVTKTHRDIEQIIMAHPDSQVIILGLPDSFEAYNQIWKPYLWRCGLEIFKEKITTNAQKNIPTYLMHGYDEKYYIEKLEQSITN